MRDRIHAAPAPAAPPTEADEALQRACTAMTAETRTLMADAGRALRSVNPQMIMREVTRLAYASSTAAALHGPGTPHAVAATGLLLRHMPRLDWPTPATPLTRAEYGLQLIRTARQAGESARVAELHRQAAADYAGRNAREPDARNALADVRTSGNAAASAR